MSFTKCLILSAILHVTAIAGIGSLTGMFSGNPPPMQIIEVSIYAPEGAAGDPDGGGNVTALSAQPAVLPVPDASPDIRGSKLKLVTKQQAKKPMDRSVESFAVAAARQVSRNSITETGTAGEHDGTGDSGKAQGSRHDGQGGSPLKIAFAPRPPYPWAARVAGFEGKLALDVVVGADGAVKNIDVVSSSGREDCDRSAADTVLNKWRFEAAQRDGQPVETRERIIVRYALK